MSGKTDGAPTAIETLDDIGMGAALAYSENTALRAAVNVIPYIGGALDVLFSAKGQAIIQQRVNHVLACLAQEINGLDADKVDHDYLQSEEFFDVMLTGIEEAARIRDIELRQHAAKILAGAIQGRGHATISVEHVLGQLRTLSPMQLRVARAIYEQQKNGPPVGKNNLQWASEAGWENLPQLLEMDVDEVLASCLVLQGTGMLREITGTYLDYTGGVFLMTPVLARMMQLASVTT